MTRKSTATKAIAAAALMVGVAGCGTTEPGSGVVDGVKPGALHGAVTLDGSSTVFPIAQAMAEDFGQSNPMCQLTVNKSGTGSGFQKFVRGELDMADASRPIEPKEDADLKAKGMQYLEIPIAFDGVSVIVNPQNTWVDKLTMQELKRAWNSKSTVTFWSDIRPTFPHEQIEFHGPTENHGTFEYFTEAVNGADGDIRKDCQKDQEYTAIVQSVAGDRDAIAYVGFNYYDQNNDKVKIVPVDSGKGPVIPTEATIADGAYTPLSRPLFFYASKQAYDAKPQVRAFVQFALSAKGAGDVKESSYVALPQEMHNAVVRRVDLEQSGSVFEGVMPGAKLAELYAKLAGN